MSVGLASLIVLLRAISQSFFSFYQTVTLRNLGAVMRAHHRRFGWQRYKKNPDFSESAA
jgi:hypothetical protein